MNLYRIDNRVRSVGDIILPQDLYTSALDQKRLEIESLIEKYRPESKPSRSSVLMLYKDFTTARNHWLKQINSCFYQVKTIESGIIHEGDSAIIEFIFSEWENRKHFDYTKLANQYWESVLSEQPLLEVFVKEAYVIRIISNSEKQRINELIWSKRASLPNLNPDPDIPRIIE